MVGKETTPPELQQGSAEPAGDAQTDREIRIEPRTLKGFNDYLPEAASRREWIMEQLRRTFASWGYVPLETPRSNTRTSSLAGTGRRRRN